MTQAPLIEDPRADPAGPAGAPGTPASRPPAAALPLWAAARVISALGGRLLDLVYPPSCIACAASTAVPHALCPACWRSMPFIERPYCERLGTPFAADFGGTLLSPAALADPPVYERARAVARHDGPARSLVQRLKYGDRLDLAPALARAMDRAGAQLLDGLQADGGVIVPVPMHRLRLWRRRMNQAAVLALALHKLQADRRPAVALALGGLARRRATRPQVGLSRAERARNLQGVFVVPDGARHRIEGRRVLLLDDVLTTGSTANAASRALLRAGATGVDVLVFTRVCSAP